MPELKLHGCQAEPLASYLKALAVLRLVSEQVDPGVRGWWDGSTFVVRSRLEREDLLQFLLESYQPTPIVAPWNGGSGFYEGSAAEDRERIRTSLPPRLEPYRKVITQVLGFSQLPPTNVKMGEVLDQLERSAAKAKGKTGQKDREFVAEIRELAELLDGQTPLGILLDHPVSSVEKLKCGPDQARALKAYVKEARKAVTKLKKLARSDEKEAIVQECRSRLSGSALEWVDTAVILDDQGALHYPPMLGTAGSEGNLDYTRAFMEAIGWLLLSPPEVTNTRELLGNALFDESAAGFRVASVGQYDPGRSGGYNQGPGIESKDFPTNPWNLVLLLEGTVAWGSGLGRRHGVKTRKGRLASPFTVSPAEVGFTSATEKEKKETRAEVWTPLWTRPTGYPELRAFLAEGRADIGSRPAATALDLASAAASLGVDRGVTEFVRFSLVKRRGDSYVALPAGRFPVQERSESDVIRELEVPLRQLDLFLSRFRSDPPASFSEARRRIDEARFQLLLQGGAQRMQTVLRQIGRAEKLLARRNPKADPSLKGPLGGLSARWIPAADDDGVEFRLATALASISSTGKVGPIRANLGPINPDNPFAYTPGAGQMAWEGPDFSRRLLSVLERRLIDAEKLGCGANPTLGRVTLHPGDITAFINGSADESRTEELFFGLTWMKWHEGRFLQPARDHLLRWNRPVESHPITRAYALLKLLFLPYPFSKAGGAELRLMAPRQILQVLKSGRVGDACEQARRRLFASGLEPLKIDYHPADDVTTGVRLAAALLFPVGKPEDLARLVLANPISQVPIR